MPGACRPRMHGVGVGALLCLVFAGVVLIESEGASAGVTVACGDTIVSDTTLAADLTDCPDNGIIIGADHLILDLNGHTIDGDGELFEPCSDDADFCDVGVANNGHRGLRVVDGSVTGFAVGVFIYAAHRNRMVGVSSSLNDFFGFFVVDSAGTVIRDSSGSDNLAPDGDGLGLFGSHGSRVVGNTFEGNTLGIHVSESNRNLFRGNVISRTDGPGMLVEANQNEIRSKVCRRNGICILVGRGDGNVIARNRVRADDDGIAVENGSRNRLIGNRIVRTRGSGIYLGLVAPPIGGHSNVVRENVVIDSRGDAFKVRRKDAHSILRGNIARRARDDGFSIQSTTSKLVDDRAIANGELGIRARGRCHRRRRERRPPERRPPTVREHLVRVSRARSALRR